MTADAYGYLKLDLLRVTVVEIIAKTFKEIGIPVMTVDELLEKTKGDKEVWSLYAQRFVQGLNQCEQPKSSERMSRYKAQNIVELSAFVGAIRPGFKSMLDTFITRTPFEYGIPSLDKLLQTKEIPSSFLLYDEQVLSVLIAAGIPAADAYKCLKAIKKKKAEKVAPFKILFKEGFSRHLQEDEGKSQKDAEKVCDQILKILEDSASYLFNASHALCVACDSLYVAYLKAHYPYELYLTMLKIWDEKHRKDKISSIIGEMKRYQNISLTVGKFGQDNRDWVVDRKNKTISQSISSVGYMSKKVAYDLFRLGKNKYDTFTDLLRDLQMETCLDTRQIKILIELDYFKDFGASGKLMKVYEEFFNGENKITKTTTRSLPARLDSCRRYEQQLPEDELDIMVKLRSQIDNVGLGLSSEKNAPSNVYYVLDVDSKYGIKSMFYSIQRGTTGVVRFRKDMFAKKPFEAGDCVTLEEFDLSPRYTYRGGNKVALPGEKDIWAKVYKVKKAPNRN